jgi:hypothetical protein
MLQTECGQFACGQNFVNGVGGNGHAQLLFDVCVQNCIQNIG